MALTVCRLRAGWCAASLVAAVWLTSFSMAAGADFPQPVTPILGASFQMAADGQSLRELVANLRRHTGLRIHLDRRLDPDQVVSAENLGPTVQDVLDQLTAAVDATWVAGDELVILGNQPALTDAATEAMRAWDDLGCGENGTTSLCQSRPVQWPRLTTPAEALRIVAEQWDLTVVGPELPHDLWAATDLGSVRVTTALCAVLSGFDLGYEINASARQVTVRPLNRGSAVERSYPHRTLPPEVRSSLLEKSPAGAAPRLSKADSSWVLRGDATAHQRLAVALLRIGGKREVARDATVKLFSLRLENKTVEETLGALCQQGGYRLSYDRTNRSIQRRLNQRISLTAVDQSIDQLMEQAAAQAELDASIEGDIVTITIAK